ncbi:ABC transporter ATP-binding protein [Anaerolineales bacterium]
MIEVKQLSKQYGNHLAVDDISFTVKENEIVGLLGPNGAGKTTTMPMITGFTPPTKGNITINGYDSRADSIQLRKQVGYMPENVPLYPEMTVESYIKFWARLRGVKKVNERTAAVLEEFDLTDRRKQLTRNLSKGLRQRLGLAQAIVHEPSIIILDEPTIGIDPQQVIEVRETIQKLKQRHTILFSSHLLSEVEQMCDKVIIINQGKILAQGSADLLSQQIKPGQYLYVEIRGASPQKVQEQLVLIPTLQSVERKDNGYLLQSEHNQDIRAEVNQIINQNNWTLLELRQTEISLEDIFLSLVQKGKRS